MSVLRLVKMNAFIIGRGKKLKDNIGADSVGLADCFITKREIVGI